MRNIKTKYLWLMVLALFIIAVGLIVGCAYTSEVWNTILIVFLAIDFIALTIVIQMASYKSFRYKPKKAIYPRMTYSCDKDIEDYLDKNYEVATRDYGKSYLKIDGTNAFKVAIIKDSKAYFAPHEEEKGKPNKKLDKCTKMVGLEIFISPSADIEEKIPDFSLQADKIYYTALGYSEGIYICYNYLEPEEGHKANYEALFNELGLKEI